MKMIEYLQEHLEKAAMWSVGGYMGGQAASNIYTIHIPPIFIESLQSICYSCSIIIASVAFFGWAKKRVTAWLKQFFKK